MALLEDGVVAAARAHDIVGLIEKYIKLQRVGGEYSACCPFHKEKTPSFTVNPKKNFYYCFGCGASGGPIDFVSNYESVGFRDAVERIVGYLPPDGSTPQPRESFRAEQEAEWRPIAPVSASVQPMDTINRKIAGAWVKLHATARWEYRSADGGLIGYVYRFDLPTGGKDVIPQSWCVNNKTGEAQWRWLSFDKPRSLYGLDKLARHPLAQVIVAEGEKAADAGQALYEAAGISRDKLVVVSWPGGGRAVKFTDWEPLSGRSVALWPDADQQCYPDIHPDAGEPVPLLLQPGTTCMLDIAERLEGTAKSLKIIVPPSGVADGWDLADPAPEGFNLLAHTKSASMLIPDFLERFAIPDDSDSDEPPSWAADPIEPDAESAEQPPFSKPDPVGEHDDNELLKNGYFTILGYDGDDYFFFHHEKKQVLRRSKGDFSDIGLIELAPVNWWEEYFAGEKGAINKKAAVNWIFRTANSRGIYDPTRVRGRGAWTDKGRAVYHHGGYLTIDGVKTDITAIKSGYVYPMARSMLIPSSEPLTDAEGEWLVEVASLPRWSTPGSAALMAGYVMLAPICGALSWRPHVWLAGEAGSGKTTIQMKYCGGLTRGISVIANGNSTEAGIRQELKGDALPVLVDEFESNNERERQRVENVMSLIRQTSSETQAKTLKGTVTGSGIHYDIRSMFCLASINTNLPTKADVDRLTILSLKTASPKGPDNWERLEADLNRIDEDATISSRMLARALTLMPVILESIKVFRRVAAKHFKRQRDGDQYGTLLAGCWCIQKSFVPSDEQAQALIDAFDWSEHREDSDSDEAARALEAVLAAKLRVGTAGEFSVFEVIRETSTVHRHGVIDAQIADATLRRHGIRVEHSVGELWFGTGVSTLKQLVEKMAFVTDLRGQILRVPGAKRLTGVKKFNGVDSKCISVPLGPILGEEIGCGEMPI